MKRHMQDSADKSWLREDELPDSLFGLTALVLMIWCARIMLGLAHCLLATVTTFQRFHRTFADWCRVNDPDIYVLIPCGAIVMWWLGQGLFR